MPDPGEGPPPAGGDRLPKTIRVIETRHHLIDPATASQEELALAIEAASAVPSLADMAGAPLDAVLDLARALQGPLGIFFAGGLGAPAPEEGLTGTADTLSVRDLLAFPAVRPLVAARAGPRPPGGAAGIRSRAAARARTIDENGCASAVTAEEPFEVIGFAVDPLAAGGAVFAAAGRKFLGTDVAAAGGMYSTAALAAGGPVRPAEFVRAMRPGRPGAVPMAAGSLPHPVLVDLLRGRGFAAALAAAAPPAAILRRSRAAVEFYYGGAAAATGFARVAAAARGPGGRSAGPVLAAEGGLILARRPGAAAPPPGVITWRDGASSERLRWLAERLAATSPIAGESGWALDLDPLYGLYRAGALGVYLSVLVEGRDSPRIESFVEAAGARRVKAAQLVSMAQGAAVSVALARRLLSIAEDKFGAARASAILEGLRSSGARTRGAPGGSLARVEDAIQVDDSGALLALLTPREREVVELEHRNQTLSWAAEAGNRCPHVREARRLRRATDAAAALAALQKLSPYFASAVSPAVPRKDWAPEWLMCRSCGFRALCPHVRELVHLTAKNAPHEEVRERLLRYSLPLRTPFRGQPAGPSGGGDAFSYCRLCSARLAEAPETNQAAEALGRYGELDSGLRTRIWVFALAAGQKVAFPSPTDERRFARTVTDAVYPLLLSVEEALVATGRRRREPGAKSRAGPAASRAKADPLGDDPEQVSDPRTLLYAILFVYAYILDLIRSTGGRPNQEVGFAGVSLGAKESVYADRILRLIVEDHRSLITQIDDITADYLKTRFVEAYRLVRAAGSGADAPAPSLEEELAAQIVTASPVYRYAATVARVAGDLPPAPPTDPAGARKEFETLLGGGLPDIVKQARESARDPQLAPYFLCRTGAEVPPGAESDFYLKDPRINFFARLYEPAPSEGRSAAVAAFRALARGARGGKASRGRHERRPTEKRPAARGPPPDKPGERPRRGASRFVRPDDPLDLVRRGAFDEAYRLFVDYGKKVTSPASLEAYLADLDRYRQREAMIPVAPDLEPIGPFYPFDPAARAGFAPPPITRIYDEDGIPHDWNKNVGYVFALPSGEEVIIGCEEDEGPRCRGKEGSGVRVMAARNSGRVTPRMSLVDLICPGCGVRASAIGGLDVAKTERSVRAASEIDSFFAYYEARCPAGPPPPEGGLHNWVASSCRDCGLEETVAKAAASGAAVKSPAARAYYDRHAARYAGDRAAGEIRLLEAPQPRQPPRLGVAGLEETARGWARDYTLVVRVAELAGVAPAVVEAIGDTEGRDYSDILEGQGALPPPESPSDPRLFTRDAEVRLLLADLARLRQAGHARGGGPAFADLFAAAGIPVEGIPEALRALPNAGADYSAVANAVLRFRGSAAAHAYLLQTFCQIVLDLAAAGPLGLAFSRQELEHIIKGQRLFSRPGRFDRAAFEEDESPPVELPEEVGDVGEDVLAAAVAKDATNDTESDPFSGENMDYDTSEDNPNNSPA